MYILYVIYHIIYKQLNLFLHMYITTSSLNTSKIDVRIPSQNCTEAVFSQRINVVQLCWYDESSLIQWKSNHSLVCWIEKGQVIDPIVSGN